jgi:NADP-reducing hydrogenase subunit HndD
MSKITLTIDGKQVQVEKGKTILDAAKKINVKIPTLCYHEDLCVAGNCRVCVVEIEGQGALQASCAIPAQNGMAIRTNTPKVRNARKDIIALLVSEHNTQCTTCYRSTNCELQTLSAEYNIDNDRYLSILKPDMTVDKSSWSIEKDDSKCVRCQRCVRTCAELQHVNALTVSHKGQGHENLYLSRSALKKCGMHQLRPMCEPLPYGSTYRETVFRRGMGSHRRSLISTW